MKNWHFLDEAGSFQLESPQNVSYLYFPLVNEAGMMSAITPTLNGDIKANLNSFLTLPVSGEDLHNTRSARNFWVFVKALTLLEEDDKYSPPLLIHSENFTLSLLSSMTAYKSNAPLLEIAGMDMFLDTNSPFDFLTFPYLSK